MIDNEWESNSSDPWRRLPPYSRWRIASDACAHDYHGAYEPWLTGYWRRLLLFVAAVVHADAGCLRAVVCANLAAIRFAIADNALSMGHQAVASRTGTLDRGGRGHGSPHLPIFPLHCPAGKSDCRQRPPVQQNRRCGCYNLSCHSRRSRYGSTEREYE